MYKILLGVLFLYALPFSAQAGLVMSEIMYSLEGADTGREWVEIFNDEGSSIIPSEWRLFENGTNHKLTLVQGEDALASGAYAVVADNAENFLLDWPDFSGTLFDSSFSLKNTGETLILRDAELVDRDTVSYTSEWGADGDGSSLQYSGGAWGIGVPTPGSGTLTTTAGTSGSSGSGVETTETSSAKSFPVEPQIFAFAHGEKEVTVGADTEFTGVGLGLMDEPLQGARYVWSFGDGVRKEGEAVLHHYRYPGTYVAVLDVSSGKYSATARLVVVALPARVSVVSAHTDAITLRNDDSRELNLSWWILESLGKQFVIPEHTIILPNTELTLSSEVTHLAPTSLSDVSIEYPNGDRVAPFVVQKTISQTPAVRATVATAPIVGSTVPLPEAPTKEIAIEEVLQEASVLTPLTGGEKQFPYQWVLLLSGLIILASGSAIALRRMTKEEITIID